MNKIQICPIKHAMTNKKDKSLIIDLVKVSENLETHKKEIIVYHLEKKHKNIFEEEKKTKLLLNILDDKQEALEKTNFKTFLAGNIYYGDQRLELAIYLKNHVLKDIENHWFIENGTLLGAYRNNKFIDHDDDFDMAMLIEDRKEMDVIFKKIKSLLPKKYDCRFVSSYCDKIEIFEHKFGKYNLDKEPKELYKDVDYHYVTVDLQFYLKNDHNEFYSILYYTLPQQYEFHHEFLLPLKNIEVENHDFPCPGDIVKTLKVIYGSIHPDAKYNKDTCKYHL